MMVTTREYEILQSRDPADAEEKAAIIAKIQSIHITDPELGGGPTRTILPAISENAT